MNTKILYGLGVAAVAAIIGYALLPNDQPVSQDGSMTQPDTGAIADGDPMVNVVLPAVLSADAQIGKRGFDAKCAVCHGANAAGQNGIAPPLVHRIYEPNHHGDMAFVVAARNGVRAHHWKFGNMPAVKGLSDADVKYITRYIRELQKENDIF